MRTITLTTALVLAIMMVSATITTAATIHANLKHLLSPDLSSRIRSLQHTGDTVDVIVHLKQQVDLSRLSDSVDSKIASAQVMNVNAATKSDFMAREMVHEMQFTADLTQKPLLDFLRSNTVRSRQENDIMPLWIVNAIAVRRASVELLTSLAQQFGQSIETIEYDETMTIVPPVDTGVKPTRPHKHGNDIIEENLEYMQATDLWRLGYTGEGLTVAVVDTGVDAIAHPALKDKYRGKNGDHEYNWFDPYKKSLEPRDSDSHGTHCTGIVLGSLENDSDPTQRHFYGVAPKADFIACMGLNGGSGTNSALLKCWQFVLAPTDLKGKKADPSRRPHITSNSWGGPYSLGSKSYKKAADALRKAGIFNAVAAGNSGRSGCQTIGSPGVFDNLFTVCAMDHRNGNVTTFSSRGPVPKQVGTFNKPDACAPGQAILSTIPGGQYASYSGTSMATPHVAGAVALLWEAVPELARDVDLTEKILRLSSLEKVDPQCGASQPIPNYVYGHGNIRLLEAFKMAKAMKL